MSYGKYNAKRAYWPTGSVVYCGWNQYLAARKAYYVASKKLYEHNVIEESSYDLQCEQDTQMPLDDGYVYTKAIEGHDDYVAKTPYKRLTFREYPVKSWAHLNLPKKGMKW